MYVTLFFNCDIVNDIGLVNFKSSYNSYVINF